MLDSQVFDEPKPLPTMGSALKEMFSRYLAAGLFRVGDNGVIGWFLGMEADNNELRARVAELAAERDRMTPVVFAAVKWYTAELAPGNLESAVYDYLYPETPAK